MNRPNRPDYDHAQTSYWRCVWLALGAGVSPVPVIGFFVHAASNTQGLAILITFCWVINIVFLISHSILLLVRPSNNKKMRMFERWITAYLYIALFTGYFGVRSAVRELLAG